MNNPYTSSQIQELLAHPYISSCTSKYLSFTQEGKEKMVHLASSEYMSPRDIFQSLSFPEFIVNSSLPKESLKRWKRKVQNEGVVGLIPQTKGRKKQDEIPLGMSPPDRIAYLEAQVSYLQAQNEAFSLIRAGKYK